MDQRRLLGWKISNGWKNLMNENLANGWKWPSRWKNLMDENWLNSRMTIYYLDDFRWYRCKMAIWMESNQMNEKWACGSPHFFDEFWIIRM